MSGASQMGTEASEVVITWRPQRVAIIGAGLLGGSFGLAIREMFPSAVVIGVSRSQSSRDAAIQSGAVTSAISDVDAACDGSDLVVVSTPVDSIASIVIRASERCDHDALVIDLGSTKATIVRTVDQDKRASRVFVGTHPIAGSEKTGAEHACRDLFSGRTVIVTPSANTPIRHVERTIALWKSLHSRVVQMSPEDHDVALASVSHVPHLVASMLAGLLSQEASQLVGTGWIDTTRVASGDANLWTAICRENSPAILQGLHSASGWLERLASGLRSGDFELVRQMLEDSKRVRDTVVASRNR